MPDEILVEILKRVDQETLLRGAALVNRRFHSLCRSSVVVDCLDLRWTAPKLSLIFRVGGAPSIDKRLSTIVERVRGAKSVRFPNRWDNTSRGWCTVEHDANHRSLTSLPCPVTSAPCLTAIALTRLSGLTVLDLSGCSWMDGKVIGVLGKVLTLTSLSMRQWLRLCDDDLEGLPPNLETLDLDGCDNIGNGGMRHVAKLKHVQHLNIDQLGLVDDHGIKILSVLAKLKTFRINEVMDVTKDGMLHIANGMPEMQTLEVHACHEIDGEGVCFLGRLQKLRRLDLSDCFTLDRAYEAFLMLGTLSNLVRLDVGGCHIDDVCVEHLARHSRVAELMLAYAEITDAGLLCIAKRMKLRTLSLEGCAEIETYGALEDMRTIEGISLMLCGEVTNTVVHMVCQLPQLTHLDVRQCDLLTPPALDSIASVGTLKHLCLSPTTFGWVTGCPEEIKWIKDSFGKRTLTYLTSDGY